MKKKVEHLPVYSHSFGMSVYSEIYNFFYIMLETKSMRMAGITRFHEQSNERDTHEH